METLVGFLKHFIRRNQGKISGENLQDCRITAKFPMEGGAREYSFLYDEETGYLEMRVAFGIIPDAYVNAFLVRVGDQHSFAHRVEVFEGAAFLLCDIQLTGDMEIDDEVLEVRLERCEIEISMLQRIFAVVTTGKAVEPFRGSAAFRHSIPGHA